MAFFADFLAAFFSSLLGAATRVAAAGAALVAAFGAVFFAGAFLAATGVVASTALVLAVTFVLADFFFFAAEVSLELTTRVRAVAVFFFLPSATKITPKLNSLLLQTVNYKYMAAASGCQAVLQ